MPQEKIFLARTRFAREAWSARAIFEVCAVAAALCSLTTPAWPQCPPPPTGAANTSPGGGCQGFFSCFAGTSSKLSTYGIALPPSNGTTFQGDLNSIYYSLYYSITNANALNGGLSCYELIVVGDFPNERYFSITDNDMHYASTQHIADTALDPVNNGGSAYSDTNPYTPNQSYTANQPYMVPISLGGVPSASGACAIDPDEEDNLIDATQRHLSMDWNTVAAQSAENPSTPGTAHIVDTPAHMGAGPNTAGDIIVRNYLAPPYTGCGASGPGSCTPPAPIKVPPYLVVRDVHSGCAYYASYVQSNTLVYKPQQGAALPDCGSTNTNPPAACSAIASTVDLSSCPPQNPSCGSITNWLSPAQKGLHAQYVSVTPQACYANGDAHVYTNNLANEVAWVRGAEWDVLPSPDDAYIGGVISSGDLQAIASSGEAIEMQFQLPSTPEIPCTDGSCEYLGTEQLRYWSLSFIQQQSGTGGGGVLNADASPPPSAPPIETIASLADVAFCSTTPCYVTLIVGVGPAVVGLAGQNPTGAYQGAAPLANSNGNYSVLKGNGYTVLDLNQLTAPSCPAGCFSTGQDLKIVLRNTLPNTTSTAQPAPFVCAGQTVPFFAAEYTGAGTFGAGLMGPYVPLVSYPVIANLPATAATPTLPPASECGVLPNGPAGLNNSGLSITSNSTVTWPAFWPTSSPYANPLNCTPGSGLTTQIYFVHTQLAAEAPSACGEQNAAGCTKITVQSEQPFVNYPPLPVTIAGQGFGYLPGVLPVAVGSSGHLEVHDNGAGNGGTVWDTGTGNDPASCQMYISHWTDTSIAVSVNLPIEATNLDPDLDVFLSPLSDVGPLTFFYPSTTNPARSYQNCPVGAGDILTFYVTNPQTNATVSLSTCLESSPACQN